jgi:hypothetical protein
MNAASWLKIGAFWIGLNRTRSIAIPPTKDSATAPINAAQ